MSDSRRTARVLMKHYGQQLRTLRCATIRPDTLLPDQTMSLADLAHATGVGKAALSRIENGYLIPSDDEHARIAAWAEPLLPDEVHSDLRAVGVGRKPSTLHRFGGVPGRIVEAAAELWPLAFNDTDLVRIVGEPHAVVARARRRVELRDRSPIRRLEKLVRRDQDEHAAPTQHFIYVPSTEPVT